MIIFYFCILLLIELYYTKEISNENKNDPVFQVRNVAKDKIKNISEQINNILDLDSEINNIISETNSTLNKLIKKSKKLSDQMMDAQIFINEEPIKYLKNFIFCFGLIVILAIFIYFIEKNYEENKTKNKKNMSLHSIRMNNNNQIKSKESEDTKLYFSL